VWARPKISSASSARVAAARARSHVPSASVSAAEYPTSPSRNTRSHGTKTSSKSTVQSGMLFSRLIGKCLGSSARGAVVVLVVLGAGAAARPPAPDPPAGAARRPRAGRHAAEFVPPRRSEDMPLRALQDDPVSAAAQQSERAAVLDRRGHPEVVLSTA